MALNCLLITSEDNVHNEIRLKGWIFQKRMEMGGKDSVGKVANRDDGGEKSIIEKSNI